MVVKKNNFKDQTTSTMEIPVDISDNNPEVNCIDKDDYQFMVSACMLVHDVDAYRKWQKENMEIDMRKQSLVNLRKVVRFLNLISGDISCTMDLMSLTENNGWFPSTKVEKRLEYHGAENLMELKELSWQIEARRKTVLIEIVRRELSLEAKRKSSHD
jgi:hypothetical protein